ncbi:hypothetical protein [Teredinibacter turnerae]|nr:hypothetical protein [Teredinibacter turnerae]
MERVTWLKETHDHANALVVYYRNMK